MVFRGTTLRYGSTFAAELGRGCRRTRPLRGRASVTCRRRRPQAATRRFASRHCPNPARRRGRSAPASSPHANTARLLGSLRECRRARSRSRLPQARRRNVHGDASAGLRCQRADPTRKHLYTQCFVDCQHRRLTAQPGQDGLRGEDLVPAQRGVLRPGRIARADSGNGRPRRALRPRRA